MNMLIQSDDQFLAPVRQNPGCHVTLAPRLSVSAGCLPRGLYTLHTVALSSGVNYGTGTVHSANQLSTWPQSF